MFKPFTININGNTKQFQVHPDARIHATIKKVLRLKKNREYEIEINVREK
ncbi:hypothetical protein KAR91_44450 [Candidatus Pacearchaeota archaeon]|nr:hypothetical protein [Candidatus Pacearchaeota archaeon]